MSGPTSGLGETTGKLSLVFLVGLEMADPPTQGHHAEKVLTPLLREGVDTSPAAVGGGAVCTAVQSAVPPQGNTQPMAMFVSVTLDLDAWNRVRDTPEDGQTAAEQLADVLQATANQAGIDGVTCPQVMLQLAIHAP